MKLSFGYMTFPTKKEAKDIVVALLDRGLIACANILGDAESYFVWEGDVAKEKEIIVIFKTTEKKEAKVIKFVEKYHSYEVPCVVFLPIVAGQDEYLNWVNHCC